MPFLDDNGATVDFPVDNNDSASFKFKTKIASRIGNNDTKVVKIMVTLINCEINLILTWYANCFVIDAPVNNQVPTFAITDTKRYVPVVTLSCRDIIFHK